MERIANSSGCLYAVAGLPNIYLIGYMLGTTGSASIEKVATLHQAIAAELVKRPGPLNGPEIRFLGSVLDLMPEDLAFELGLRLDQIPDESAFDEKLARYHDRELRRKVRTHIGLGSRHYKTLDALYMAARSPAPIIIEADVESDDYWKIAA